MRQRQNGRTTGNRPRGQRRVVLTFSSRSLPRSRYPWLADARDRWSWRNSKRRRRRRSRRTCTPFFGGWAWRRLTRATGLQTAERSNGVGAKAYETEMWPRTRQRRDRTWSSLLAGKNQVLITRRKEKILPPICKTRAPGKEIKQHADNTGWCVRTRSVTIPSSTAPPGITSVERAHNPFRIRLREIDERYCTVLVKNPMCR